MTPEQRRLRLEEATAAQASAALRRELTAATVVLFGGQLRGETVEALRALIRQVLLAIVPSSRTALETGAEKGRTLGHSIAGEDGVDYEQVTDHSLQAVIDSVDTKTRLRLVEAVGLADKLPMDTQDDLLVVVGKAQSAVRHVEQSAGWVVHRSTNLGIMEAAKADDLNVVWVTERNACPNCLAYQGRVVEPGREFPKGLTYGDRPVQPFGALIAPPLHPHCRCELEVSSLQHGQIDEGLAREAARSVARGLTDFQSEKGKRRSADRLLQGTTGLPTVKLPKSVLERTARNLREGQFKARPGSAAAKAEIAKRARDRARRKARAGQPGQNQEAAR